MISKLLPIVSTGGTSINGILANKFERVCGNKGFSYDAYQDNERARGVLLEKGRVKPGPIGSRGRVGVYWTKLGTKIVITSAGKLIGSFGLIGLGKESFMDWRWNYTYLVEIALIISCRSVTFTTNIRLIAKLLLWKQKLTNVWGI